MRRRPRSVAPLGVSPPAPATQPSQVAANADFTLDTRAVLVAVRGDRNWAPLEWAAAEAAARQAPLRIVHTFAFPPTLDGYGAVPQGPAMHAGQAAAKRVLAEAVERAHAVVPDLPITAHLQPGPTVPGVLREQADDALVVLGRPLGRRRRLRDPGQSTWRRMVRESTIPVVLVGLSPLAHIRGPSMGNVVVGIHLDQDLSAVLDVAFAAASRRHVGVTVVHAWTPTGRDRGHAGREACAAAVVRRQLRARVAAHEAAFDQVPVRHHATTLPAHLALVNESVGAALVVVGVRPASRLRSAVTLGLPGYVRSIEGCIAIRF